MTIGLRRIAAGAAWRCLAALLVALCSLAILCTHQATAGVSAVDAVYEVRFAGIHISTAHITGRFEGPSYRLDLDSHYSVFLYSGTITGHVTGKLVGDRLVPEHYSLASSGDPEHRSAIDFEGTTASKVGIEPPLPPDWDLGRIRLQPKDSRDVVDPMSALVLASLRAGGDPAEACKATLPVFSGVSRFDVVLTPADANLRRRNRSPRDTIACAARYLPISGHRPSNRTVQAIAASTGLSIEYDVVPIGPVRLPRRIIIPTRLGTVTIERSEREQTSN